MATQCTNQYHQLPPPYTKKENDNEFSSIDSGFCESNEMSYSMDVDCKYAEDLPGVNILDRGQGGDASIMLPSHKKKEHGKEFSSAESGFYSMEMDCKHHEHVSECIISDRDQDGDTTLMLLIIKHNVNCARQIIQSCPKPYLLDVQNNYGQTVLHIAVFLKGKELATALISKGARIDLVDCMGRNIFHVCAEYGYLDIFKAIIEAAIRTAKFKHMADLLDAVDYDGYTPFYLAAKNENKEFCKYLHFLGVNVNAANPKNGNTVLHDVVLSNVCYNQLDFIKFLINECHVDITRTNYFEMTAAIMAELNEKQSIAEYLNSAW